MTTNSAILGRYIKKKFQEVSPEEEFSDSWKKQQRYVHECKESSWRRLFHDYWVAFREKERERERERHNLSHKEKPMKTQINDVVMIKED